MPTHIQRYKALVEAITGKKATNAQMNRIADDFISYRQDQVEAAGYDIQNMTNAQKASVVLDAYSHLGNSIQEAMYIRRGAKELANEAKENTDL